MGLRFARASASAPPPFRQQHPNLNTDNRLILGLLQCCAGDVQGRIGSGFRCFSCQGYSNIFFRRGSLRLCFARNPDVIPWPSILAFSPFPLQSRLLRRTKAWSLPGAWTSVNSRAFHRSPHPWPRAGRCSDLPSFASPLATCRSMQRPSIVRLTLGHCVARNPGACWCLGKVLIQ